LILQLETGIPRVIDPWGGSYFMESLTHALARKALVIVEEVEAMGGMTRAIEAGMPKLRIEETAARRQARVDRGEDVIVGVNKFRLDEEPEIDTREIDNGAVREAQIARLKKIRETRDPKKVEVALRALTAAAESGQGDRDGVRRPRVPGRRGDALEDAGRGRAPGDRERRARERSVDAVRRAQDPGAAAREGAAAARRRRHRRHGRRHHPLEGLRVP